ncbi:M15 family metallopeptidase [Bordetella bronchialis]|uniref:M15 family metallopeptidase n=1 Tax=Bordetella bronchialis TaxID=463025 RepID=UPI003D013CA5
MDADRQRMPPEFVDLAELAKQDKPRHIRIDMRYAGSNNFIGRPIAGYHANKCLLARRAAQAVLQVVDRLAPFGLTLCILDAYRPQRAVNDFIAWTRQPGEERMKAAFYPNVDKRHLIRDGYLAERSSHSRGSAVDVALAPIDGKPGETLDFGTPYDYFGPESHPSYQALTPQQKANRLLLRTLMTQAGFRAIETEWWHFQLAEEPFPDTYFDFPVA